ncbi:hypothetical protein DFH07DRAFT_324978 [Mycena maculata]|uniref:Uncharacterized protein n=1 Tax=Mycena maculata TaxID=230809 RepID=A0AAD7P0D0_9AGAR|nr:hypothetical protein DFH07DRAFT_324978 [Mycena maculata]
MSLINLPGCPLPLVIVRDGNCYYLAFGRGYYGHCPTRIMACFNPATTEEEPRFLPDGHPCIWLKPDGLGVTSNLIAQLLQVQPRAPIHLTGRLPTRNGKALEAVEVIMLLGEDELAHCCYYCGEPEEVFGPHGPWPEVKYKKIGGTGYASTYGCPGCLDKRSFLTRTWRRAWRDTRVW